MRDDNRIRQEMSQNQKVRRLNSGIGAGEYQAIWGLNLKKRRRVYPSTFFKGQIKLTRPTPNLKHTFSLQLTHKRTYVRPSYIKQELLVFIIYQLFAMKAFLDNDSTLSQIQNRLNKYPFLSKSHLPGYTDAFVFLALAQMHKYPELKQHPHFYHWFILIKQFSITTVHSWLTKQTPAQEDYLIHHLLSLDSPNHAPTNSASVTETSQFNHQPDAETVAPRAQTEFLLDVWEGENRDARWQLMKRQLRSLGVQVERDLIQRETRLTFKGDSRMCEDVLRIVQKSLEYRRIEVKKQRKSTLKR